MTHKETIGPYTILGDAQQAIVRRDGKVVKELQDPTILGGCFQACCNWARQQELEEQSPCAKSTSTTKASSTDAPLG